MLKWTHAICTGCWDERHPGREPIRVRSAMDPCCWCGKYANIYVREDPATAPCGGTHSGWKYD